jgi:hypothetical protein
VLAGWLKVVEGAMLVVVVKREGVKLRVMVGQL